MSSYHGSGMDGEMPSEISHVSSLFSAFCINGKDLILPFLQLSLLTGKTSDRAQLSSCWSCVCYK